MTAATAARQPMDCRIEGPLAIGAREFKTFLFPLVGTATTDLPAPPGAVQRDAAGRTSVLHFAPGRFLAPAPGADLIRHLDALQGAGVGAVFDVSGKWRAVSITGPGARRLLASGIDVEAVLAHRECAAIQLFDCPVVLAGADQRFELWVQGSYATAFCQSLERIRLGG